MHLLQGTEMLHFKDMLQSLHKTTDRNNGLYLLIDAAQQDQTIEQWLNSEPPPQVRSLFEGTLEGELPLRVAPLLLELSPTTAQTLDATVNVWLSNSPMISALSTPLSINELIAHLQPFLEAKLPTGELAIFRLFDPTVAKLMPGMLDKENYINLFMPIHEWWIANDAGLFERLPNLKRETNV